MSSQNTFILVNVIGGISVLGTYVIGITLFPEHRDDLWGGVQGKLRHVFIFSMFFRPDSSVYDEGFIGDKRKVRRVPSEGFSNVKLCASMKFQIFFIDQIPISRNLQLPILTRIP